MDYLDGLNTEQKKAVLATGGPILIVAGAGAGKTKTLTHRILHLIKTGVLPEKILAITFTNKAAKEMRERVMNLLGYQGGIEGSRTSAKMSALGHPTVSTFHSLGVQIIKENVAIFGLPKHFTIFDTADSKKAMKDAMNHIGIDPKEHLDKVQNIISAEKGRGVNLSDFLERGAYDYTSEVTKKVWKRYEEILKRDGALDFDDLLLKTLQLLKKKEILEKYQNRFVYIHVDEYQDTNKVQNDIINLLASKHQNICVVADPDQNIYQWRGSEIKNVLNFEKTYINTKTFLLVENYRSTKNILAVANEIIEKNKFRIPKKLFTNNTHGEKIGLFEGRSEVDEAHFIALTAKGLVEKGVSADEIAVLYRANFQSRVLEEAFLAYGVPYQMLGTKFFERKEIKDVIAYVTASLNPENQSSLMRIINVPARGIGKTTIDKIIDNKEGDISPATKLKINKVREMLGDFKKILETEKPSDALRYIISASGIEKMYKTGMEEDTERLENIMELVSLAKNYDEYEPQTGIENFLTESSLVSDQDSLNEQKNGVKLMTVHSSKGLEFDYVFVCGLEADLFPHKGFGQKKKSGEDAEEERRLFYVAITRARQKIFLTFAQSRTIFGKTEVNSRSEFLDDIPDKYTEKVNFTGVMKKSYFKIDF